MAFITDTGSNKLVKAKHGYMIVNCNDQYIGESIIHYGEWYEPELDLLSQFIESRDNIIEIGSNYGSHTLRLCQLAYHGKIFAIEPQRAVFQALCGNIAINSIFNCFCIQKSMLRRRQSTDNSTRCRLQFTLQFWRNFND